MLSSLKYYVRKWESEGKHPAATKILTYLYMQFCNFQDSRHIGKLKELLSKDTFPETIDEAVDLVCEGNAGRGVRPMQVKQELNQLIRLVHDARPRRVIEIGTARGGTLLLLCRFSSPDATIVSIDLPYGRNGGGYPSWKQSYYEDFALPGQDLHLLRGNSHLDETARKVADLFNGEPADFILIDADHSYAGVKRDFELYGSLASTDTIIALHDVLPNDADPSIEVHQFWHELLRDPNLETSEIVHDQRQGNCGIGIALRRPAGGQDR